MAKIAIVYNKYQYIHTFRIELIKSLLDQGHQVILMAGSDPYKRKLLDVFPECEFQDIVIIASSTNLLKEFQAFGSIFKILKRNNVDVVLNFTIKPNLYSSISCRLLKKHCINNVTGLGTAFISSNILLRLASRALIKICFKKVDQVYFQNSEDMKLFLDLKFVSSSQAILIPGSGVNTQKFKSRFGYKRKEPFTFLMISRILVDKGVLEYIRAAKTLKSKLGNKVAFRLIGDLKADNKSRIEPSRFYSLIEDQSIQYLGIKKDIPEQIEQVQCVVLPSYREGLPRTILEAMSMSRPVVATDVVGCREIVHDGVNGRLCSVKDAEDLAEKLLSVYNSTEEELISFGKNGRKLVENFYQEKIVLNQYLKDIANFQKNEEQP